MQGLNAIIPRSDNQVAPEMSVWKSKIAVHTCDGTFLIKKSEVEYARSEGNYTHIHLVDGTSILSAHTLKVYEKKLGNAFLRVHSSYLINPIHLTWVSSNKTSLRMASGDTVQVSRSKKSMISQFLAGYFE